MRWTVFSNPQSLEVDEKEWKHKVCPAVHPHAPAGRVERVVRVSFFLGFPRSAVPPERWKYKGYGYGT
jgi:hypothetical protein